MAIMRAKLFESRQVLVQNEHGAFVVDEGLSQPSLESQVEAWIQLLQVQVTFISPPNIQPMGRDAEKRMHVFHGVSVLYLAQEEVESTPDGEEKETVQAPRQATSKVRPSPTRDDSYLL